MKQLMKTIIVLFSFISLIFIFTLQEKIYAASWGYDKTKMSVFKEKVQIEIDNQKLKEEDIVVVVIDSGIDDQHPWFFDKNGGSRILTSYAANCLQLIEDNICTVGNYDDDNGHGTHVAGIISYITPDNVKILPVKVADSEGLVPLDAALAGFDYVLNLLDTTDLNIKVINFSISNLTSIFDFETKKEYSQRVNQLYDKGVMFVTSAGNAGKQRLSSWVAKAPQTIVVSSLTEDMELSYFSNYGSDVDFAAPGSSIKSAYPNLYVNWGAFAEDPDNPISVIEWNLSGTSMAAPHVTADIALIYTKCPTCTPDKINQILIDSSVDIGAKGKDFKYGYGYINMEIAYKFLHEYKVEEVLIGPGTMTKHLTLSKYNSMNINSPYANPSNKILGTTYTNTMKHFFLGGLFGGTTKNALYVSADTTIAYNFKRILDSRVKYIIVNGEKITDKTKIKEFQNKAILIDQDYYIEVRFAYWPF